MPTEMQAARRFLAFGDSLTAGYHSNGLAFCPYAPSLAAAIGVPASAFTGASGLQASQLLQRECRGLVIDKIRESVPERRHGLEHRRGIDKVVAAPEALRVEQTAEVISPGWPLEFDLG